MFLEAHVESILLRDFQESYGQQKLLNMALFRIVGDSFVKVVKMLETKEQARELVSKLTGKGLLLLQKLLKLIINYLGLQNFLYQGPF